MTESEVRAWCKAQRGSVDVRFCEDAETVWAHARAAGHRRGQGSAATVGEASRLAVEDLARRFPIQPVGATS